MGLHPKLEVGLPPNMMAIQTLLGATRRQGNRVDPLLRCRDCRRLSRTLSKPGITHYSGNRHDIGIHPRRIQSWWASLSAECRSIVSEALFQHRHVGGRSQSDAAFAGTEYNLPDLVRPHEQGDSSMLILLAEDDRELARAVAAALTEDGNIVVMAENGTATEEQLRSNPFDLLLLDIGMPDPDGWQILRQLR